MPIEKDFKEEIQKNIHSKRNIFVKSYYENKLSFMSKAFDSYNGSKLDTLFNDAMSKDYSNRAVNILCILFSDLDPSLYDCNEEETRMRLKIIYEELFHLDKPNVKNASRFMEAIGMPSISCPSFGDLDDNEDE